MNYLLYIHVGSLCVAGCGILVADKLGLSWMRGKIGTLRPKTLHILHEVMGGALALLIGTGLLLFWPERTYLVTQPLFYVKLGFVAVLILNSFIIDKLMHMATHTPFSRLGRKAKRALFISGAVSAVCWAGAALTALILF